MSSTADAGNLPAMPRVLLLFGGRSAEHEVSCVSAGAVRDALAAGGHHVTTVGIDRAGRWWYPPQDAAS